MPDSSPKHWSTGLREAEDYIGIGLQMAGTMVASVLGGYWLDTRFDTSPWLLLGGISLGFIGVFALLYKITVQANADTARKQKARKKAEQDRSDRPS